MKSKMKKRGDKWVIVVKDEDSEMKCPCQVYKVFFIPTADALEAKKNGRKGAHSATRK
jgi:hypothetical protein